MAYWTFEGMYIGVETYNRLPSGASAGRVATTLQLSDLDVRRSLDTTWTSSDCPAVWGPVGYLDGVTSTGVVSGWGADLGGMHEEPVAVEITVGGCTLADGSPFGAKTPADLDSPDVPIAGKHRFSYQIPNRCRDGNLHRVQAAINFLPSVGQPGSFALPYSAQPSQTYVDVVLPPP
jgi:hypothetical protein